jgi:hypothetical protein
MIVPTRPYLESIGPRLLSERSRANKQTSESEGQMSSQRQGKEVVPTSLLALRPEIVKFPLGVSGLKVRLISLGSVLPAIRHSIFIAPFARTTNPTLRNCS